ncbi:DUF3137 domain-containing protein [Vreelandella stevensii]|uniref:DUF3137 domain-containing protein n=1 Tax=Vreelandella stevensii TaxID=502821 RepID=UPI003748012D
MSENISSPHRLSENLKNTVVMAHLLKLELGAFIKHTLLRKKRAAPLQQLEDVLDDGARKTFESELHSLEQLRQEINSDAWVLRKIAFPALIIYIVASLALFPFASLLNFWVLALPITLLCLPAGLIKDTYFETYKRFNDQFRSTFIPAVAKSFGNVEYKQHGFIDLERLKRRLPQGATSFDRGLAIARAEQEDYFRGEHRGCHWELVHATFTNQKHKKTFSGLILMLELPRSFEGTTVINMRNPANDSTRVHLENSKFLDWLVVSSTDQISARSWLTPAVIERLHELRQLFNGLKANLTGSSLLLLLDTPDFLPLPPIDVPLTEAKPCLLFATELKTVYQLIDTLLAQFPDLPPQNTSTQSRA